MAKPLPKLAPFPTEQVSALLANAFVALPQRREEQRRAPTPYAPPQAAPKRQRRFTGRATRTDNTPLTVLAQYNPYRFNTKAWKTFELFKTCATVGEARANANDQDHDLGYLNYASRDGYINIGTDQ